MHLVNQKESKKVMNEMEVTGQITFQIEPKYIRWLYMLRFKIQLYSQKPI